MTYINTHVLTGSSNEIKIWLDRNHKWEMTNDFGWKILKLEIIPTDEYISSYQLRI